MLTGWTPVIRLELLGGRRKLVDQLLQLGGLDVIDLIAEVALQQDEPQYCSSFAGQFLPGGLEVD